ncbi:MAG: hypothetical protein ACXVAX_09615 [Pseudobdellovibrio sp.]
MKQLLLAATLMIAGLTAQAHTPIADGFNTIYSCNPIELHPDLGMNLTVEQGGFAGITQITIKRFFLGHNTTEQYVVKQKVTVPNRIGAPTLLVGEGIQLSINFTTAPLKDGGHYSVLSLNDANGNVSNEELSCQILMTRNNF